MDEPKDDKAGFVFNPKDTTEETESPEPTDPAPNEPLNNEHTSEKDDEPLFNWSAPNSYSSSKSFNWYLILIVCTLVLTAAVFFITKDKITTAVIVVSGLLVGVYAAKKPKNVNYQLTKYGFAVNGRHYRFGEFRSYTIVSHGSNRSAVLTPLKRFVPYMYINFASDMEQEISNSLADVLPQDISHKDTLDNVLRKIGF
ncbi:MAG: hypothetical protein WDN66_01640 [Candidatus Saccharibacteria bacterium]